DLQAGGRAGSTSAAFTRNLSTARSTVVGENSSTPQLGRWIDALINRTEPPTPLCKKQTKAMKGYCAVPCNRCSRAYPQAYAHQSGIDSQPESGSQAAVFLTENSLHKNHPAD